MQVMKQQKMIVTQFDILISNLNVKSEFDRIDTIRKYRSDKKQFDLTCWCCSEGMSFDKRVENDGFCPHCQAEIELD